MQMWYCEFVLKWKRSHFRSTCVTQKRLCLSSLIYSSADHPFLWVTPRKQSYPPFPACLIFSFFLTLEFPFQAFTVTWVVPDDCTADGPTPWFHQLFTSLLGDNSHCTHFDPIPSALSPLESVFNTENTSIQARVFGFSGSQGRLQLFWIMVLHQPFSKDVSNRAADLPDQSPSTTAHIAKSFNGFIIFEWGFDPVHANICCGFLLVVKVGIVNLFTGVGWMFLLSKMQLDTYLLGKLASVPSHDCGSRRHEKTNLRHILLFLLCTLNNTSFFFRLIYIILNFRVIQPYVITC